MKNNAFLLNLLAGLASCAGLVLLVLCVRAMPFTEPMYPWLVLAGLVLTPLWPMLHYWRATDVLLKWKHRKAE